MTRDNNWGTEIGVEKDTYEEVGVERVIGKETETEGTDEGERVVLAYVWAFVVKSLTLSLNHFL